MIISQTPLRISFLGGGTDFEDFYRREPGMVIGTSIDKYIFVIVKRRFDPNIRIGYSITELVDSVEDVQHALAREALYSTGVSSSVEMSTIADIPSEGTGLGSSSAVTAGLLNSLYMYNRNVRTQEQIAQEACEIEIEHLKKPIGKQDQYLCALGGLRVVTFNPDGTVLTERLELTDDELVEFEEHFLLFYSGITRKADVILEEQVEKTETNWESLIKLRDLAVQARDDILDLQFESLGHAMHEGWLQKRKLASTISNPQIDEVYSAAREAGALGGKITGAGGGGFFLFFCPPAKHRRVRRVLSRLRELPFKFDLDGTKIIFNNQRR